MKQKKKEWSIEKRLAVACLLLNIFVAPGLGSFTFGLKRIGTMQMGATIVGLILMIFGKTGFLIGMIVSILAWVWGIVTSLQILKHVR